ncbi:hypothetical protein H1R20_g6736, partial [Candolleomyces eurysporus]
MLTDLAGLPPARTYTPQPLDSHFLDAYTGRLLNDRTLRLVRSPCLKRPTLNHLVFLERYERSSL